MFKLIKNVEVYNPHYIGKKDILICHTKIIKIEDHIVFNDDVEVIDKSGMIVIPGIIDQHVHLTGGGGEGGFHTRTPEVQLTDLVKYGVTTVVGLLGTDAMTRSIEDLVAKTKALRNEGLTAYCLTGSYQYPSITLTGTVGKDIAFIDEIIGLKLAISDHREPMITKNELARLVSEVRVSGMISGKASFITLHMGGDEAKLDKVFEIIDETSIPIKHFRPTHVNRTHALYIESLKFLKRGGYIDLTVGNEFEKLKADVDLITSEGLPFDSVTFSSDGNGSWSNYDAHGILTEIGVQSCDGILLALQYLVKNGYKIEDTIGFGSTHVAHALNLHDHKGYIKVNYDADLLICDHALNIDTVLAKGKVMMKDQKCLVKGTFEL